MFKQVKNLKVCNSVLDRGHNFHIKRIVKP